MKKPTIPKLPDKHKIGGEIKQMVSDKGVDIKDLAKAIGRTTQTVKNIFIGNTSYEMLERTIKTLDKWEK